VVVVIVVLPFLDPRTRAGFPLSPGVARGA
jgi:hypothetical protein